MGKLLFAAVFGVGIYWAMSSMNASIDDASLSREMSEAMGPFLTVAQMEASIARMAERRGLHVSPGAVKVRLSEPFPAGSLGVLSVFKRSAVATLDYDRTVFFNRRHVHLKQEVTFDASARMPTSEPVEEAK